MHKGELVFAFFDEGWSGDCLVGGGFGAVERDGVAGDKLAGFAFAGGQTGGGEGVNQAGADGGCREVLG